MDETIPDYERFERRQLAQDRDSRQANTADVGKAEARSVVDSLIDEKVVIPDGEGKCYYHEPSGTAFDSSRALVHFHRGWKAGQEDS
jgi:hypothetical protein